MTGSRRVLVVNRTPRNAELLGEFLNRKGYDAVVAGDLKELDRVIDGTAGYNLALIDVSGFDESIWTRCSRLHSDGVPFLIISPPNRAAGHEQGLRHGARGVLRKPLAMRELSHLIDSLVS